MAVRCVQNSMAHVTVIPPENSPFRARECHDTIPAHPYAKKNPACIRILGGRTPFLKINAHHNSNDSPFTECKGAPKWLHRYPTVEASSCSLPSEEEAEIAMQLPELREMLRLLRSRGQREANTGKEGSPGNVYLVGTGPGDPELLTLKALRLMQTADLVLYDRLVSTDIMDMVHSGARLLYVGKTVGYHSRTQDEIHQLLLNFAEAGATVVRLKGGDPLVFGRGGEEMDFLQQQGIQVKVIPGITAASGIAASLGIPLTHRGVANNVRFLTGHSRKGGTNPLFVTKHAADPDSTLVIYMGLATISTIAHKLISEGLSPIIPAAAIERGTTPQQRVVFAELQNLADDVINAQLVSPTLIIIGNVVALSPYWPANSSTGQTEKNKSKANFSEAV